MRVTQEVCTEREFKSENREVALPALQGPIGNGLIPALLLEQASRDVLPFVDSMPDPAFFRRTIGNLHPVGRTGKPEDVANLVTWLASAEARRVIGQTWTIDGGRMTKLSLPL